MWEFWRDKVDKHVEVMDEFFGPLLEEALAKKKVKGEGAKVDEELEEGVTLLEHLVQLTDGTFAVRSGPTSFFICELY